MPAADFPEERMTTHTIETWRQLVADKNASGVDALLAEDVVFHSPITETPQTGKAVTLQYLAAAFDVFSRQPFRYVREVVGERDAVLEFEVEIDGVRVNGVDMIRWNDEGRIVDFKVMLRPMKAVKVMHQKIAASLQAVP
jgi:predicted aconitase